MKRILPLALLIAGITAPVGATSFVIPTDEELLSRSAGVVIGTAEGSYVQMSGSDLRTIYEIRIVRALKGAVRPGELVRIVSPEGFIGDRGVVAEGAPRFRAGERVLLFLSREANEWLVTDLTLGKFRFAVSTAGERLLVRDLEDAVIWDRTGRLHKEPVRREQEFLRFIEERVRNRAAPADYFVDAASVTLSSTESELEAMAQAAATSYPPRTYTSNVNGSAGLLGTRWPSIAAGVTFRKRASTNIGGLADGGVSVIQNGTAAWTNECGSVINLIYGGTTATASANFDAVNVVEFNDPQGRVPNTWTGAGTIAITFTSYSGTHSFAGDTWWSTSDADVVFQDGYPGTHASFPTAMTHELGHAIGWRHSNAHHQSSGTDQPCDPAREECSDSAIMYYRSISSLGYTLQSWDINAAQSVYPGGTCGPSCVPPTITAQPVSQSVSYGTTVTLAVTASGTSLTYQWFRGASGDTSSPMAGYDGPQLPTVVTATATYWVRVSNACGTVNSASATVSVSSSANATKGDLSGDGKSDIVWRHVGDGTNYVWFMNGAALIGTSYLPSVPDVNWRIVGLGDFDGDGGADIVWRHLSSGDNYVWYMSGVNQRSGTSLPPERDVNWQAVAIADFNRDGRPDILWRNRISGTSSIWLMNNRTLSSSVVLPAVDVAWRIEGAADMNGDGNTDIIWRHAGNGENYVWLMNGTAQTGGISLPAVPDTGWDIEAIADFDGNGSNDLVWRHYANGTNYIWFMTGLQQTGASYLPTVPDLNWRMSGPR